MKYAPWLLAALLIGTFLGCILSVSQPTFEIGLIDMGRIIDESPKARELTERLSQRYNELLAEIQPQRDDLDEDALAELERSAYAAYLEFRQELENQFQIALDEAIADVAKAKKIKIVFDKELVRYGGKDLSAQVIQRLK